jgi:hypothetical protein
MPWRNVAMLLGIARLLNYYFFPHYGFALRLVSGCDCSACCTSYATADDGTFAPSDR